MDIADASSGCPAPFAACLTPAAAQALATQIDEQHRWAADAWARCGVAP